MYDLRIEKGMVYINGAFVKTNVYINGEKIALISEDILDAKQIYDASSKKVLPGFIDPHVHFALQIGKYRSSDDFYSGSIAGAYGGVTTYIDFLDPVSNGPDLELALQNRLQKASKSVTDYCFHATVMNPVNHVDEIVAKLEEYDIKSLKLFTTYSDSNRRTYDAEIEQLLLHTKSKDFIVLAHIENDDMITINDRYTFHDLLQSRPTESEISEVKKICDLIRKTQGNLYMVHLSSGRTLKLLSEDYRDILNKQLFIESCPHYFVFNSNYFQKENGYLYTLAPPLREEEDTKYMYDYIDSIYSIGTDHCPFMKQEKNHTLLKGLPLGIGGIEHSFSIMYTLFKEHIIDKFTSHPAKVYGLYPRKGIIQVGSDADIVIYDDSFERTINENHSKCDYSVYQGSKVLGQVESTINRGKFIIKHGTLIGGNGIYLRKVIL